jgi:hypothetical protein
MPAGITTTLLLSALVCAVLALSMPGAATVAFIFVGAAVVSEIVFFILAGLTPGQEPQDGLGT